MKSSRSNALVGFRTPRRSHAAIWNRKGRGIESVRWRPRINFTRFRRRARHHAAKTPAGVRSCVAHAVPMKPSACHRARKDALKTRDMGYRPREKCARSDGAPKWPRRNLKSAACGWPSRQAYPRSRSCGRVAEGGGLLNRYRVVKPYRGFESLRLRHPTPSSRNISSGLYRRHGGTLAPFAAMLDRLLRPD
jgi:hypothetical protein